MSTTAPPSTPPTATEPAVAERPGWVWGVSGVLAVIGGLLVTGAYAPTIFGDAGPFVRWSLPVATVLTHICSSAVIGLLLAAAFFVPQPSSPTPDAARTASEGGRREVPDDSALTRRLAMTWVTRISFVWFVAAVVVLLTTFADLAGLPLADPGFAGQLGRYLWDLEVTRVLLISALLVLVVLVGSVVANRRAPLVWLCVFAVVAVIVKALTGHAAGSADHETAVNALAVHLLGVVTWTGGLFALVVLRRRFGRRLGVVVGRFSVLAAWGYGAVVLSGVQQAWIRVGGFDGLTTPYGLLMLAKVALSVALGIFGWRQRRVLAARLTVDPGDRGAFTRLALGELVLMGLATGLGAALGRSAPPVPESVPNPSVVLSLTGYPDPGPISAASFLTAWRIEWLFLAVALVAMALYAAGVRRLHQRGDAWPWYRTACWMAGWLGWIYFSCGAPEIWGRVLFSVHMLMHMGVAMLIPILLVPGAPLTLALRALHPRTDGTWGVREVILQVAHSRALRFFANPVVAAVLFFFSLAAFYYTGLFHLALTTHTGHLLMMGHFVATGYLFVWVLIGIDPGPPRWSPLYLLMVLFATIAFHAFFGVILTDSQILLAPDFFPVLDLPWAPTPLEDQHLAGEIAWGIGEVPTLVLAIIVARQWVRSDEHESRRRDRKADRDGDAELVAYNAYLERLNAQDGEGPQR